MGNAVRAFEVEGNFFPEGLMSVRIFRTTVLASVLAVTAACEGDATNPTANVPDPATVVSNIALLNAPASVELGQAVQLAATALNGSGVAIAGSITWSSSDTRVATVSTTGMLTPLTPGVTTITAQSGEARASTSLTVRPPPCSASIAMATLALAVTASDSITDRSCMLPDGQRAVGHRVTLSIPTRLQIDLVAPAFNGFIHVTTTTMERVAARDARASGQAERLIHTFAPGTYIIWATDGSTTGRGAFELSARVTLGCNVQRTAGVIVPGQVVQGSLTPDSCLLPNDFAAVGWRLTVTEPTSIRVEQTGLPLVGAVIATGVAPSLPIVSFALTDGSGQATFTHMFSPGEYIIWGTTIDGSYGNLSIAIEATPFDLCGAPTGVLTLGQSIAEALDASSCFLVDGRRAKVWSLTVPTASRVQIDLTSTQFDAFLVLQTAIGSPVGSDDDGGSGVNARLDLTMPAGDYRVIATTFLSGMSGTYQLTAQTLSADATPDRNSRDNVAPKRGIRW